MTCRDTTLCIFVKAPRAGAVKTRLATTVGAEAAARLAGAFFWDTLALAEQIASCRVVVALAGNDSMFRTLPDRVEVWPQGEGDLGARLERILQRALAERPRAVAIGTDSPGLPATFLLQALTTLDAHDAVLGPADDGGFYLLGLRVCPTGLLQNIPWSTSETCARTLERLQAVQFTVGLLPPWFDVDTTEELDRLAALLRRGEAFAPMTLAALRELGLASL